MGNLYCFSDQLNILALQLAGLFSIITALCFPLLTLLFGRAFNEFVNYAIAEKFRLQNLTIYDYFCELENGTMAQSGVLGYLDNCYMLQFRVATLTFLTLGISLVFFVVAGLSRSFSAVAAAQTGRKLRCNCFSTLVTRHVGWFEVNMFSELTTLLLEGMQIVEIGLTQSIVVLQQSVSIVFCLVIAFVINWKLALVTSFLLPFLVLLIFIIGKTISLVADKEQDALLVAASVAEESLASIETVKIFEGQEKELNRYLYHIARANRQSRKILMLTALMVGLLYLFILTLFTTGSWFGLQLMTQCQCDAGSVFLVTAEIVICAFSISELLPAAGEVVTAVQSSALINGIINQRSKIDPTSNHGMIIPNFEGGIEFSDVVFSYPSSLDEPVLNGVTFKVRPREIVALIGPSGCGKSTIMSLIPRLYNIQEGMIRFDNVDGRYLSVKWLRSQIGVVSQEPVLFNISIAENIGYGKEGATMEEIIFAAKMANAHGFITDLPYGYTSIVGGKGGIHLNRGQEQLVTLARALVRDPKILLLDAITSDLDKEMEKTIQEGIRKASEGRTTIIVTHRLSTLQTSDLIICFDKGHVIEMGRHSQLMEENTYYKSMLVNEAYKDEFSSILEERACSNDVDSNKLSDEFDRPSKHLSIETEETSEKSPLLLKSVSTPSSQSVGNRTKRTTVSLYREILSIVLSRAHWFLLIAALVFFVLAGVIFSSFFILFDKLVEYLDSIKRKQLLVAAELYTPFFSLLGVLVLVLNFVGYTILSKCEEGLSRGIKEKTFRALLNQQLQWFVKLKKSAGVLSNMLATDTNKISQVLGVRIGSIAWSVVALLGAMAASFALCWPIGVTILPSYIWLLSAGYFHCKFTERYIDIRNVLLRDGAKTAAEAIRNIYAVACFGIEELLIRKYKNLLEEPFRYDLKHAAINGVTYGLSQMLTFLFIGFGYLVGIFLVTSTLFSFTYSDVLISLFTVWFSSQIFKGRFDIIIELQEGALSTHKVLNYFSRRSNMPFKHLYGSGRYIVPRNTDFSLQLNTVWLDGNLSSRESSSGQESSPILSVHPGKTLALVGPGLSYKATVLSVAMEFDNPSPSSLQLDGIDICDLNLTWFQRQVGIISKNPRIFSQSVLDNIRYGANFRKVSVEEVISIAQAAGVNEVLTSLPEGYHTIVGYNGYELSLEQRLCVGIIRALIRDPKILFLDDMVPGVNPNMEKTILRALDWARKGRTTIIIAHRLSTIKNADSVAVLHKGRVIEHGTRSKLLERKGAYFITNDILEKF